MNGPTFAATAAPPAARPPGPRPAARPAKPDLDAGGAGRALTYLRLHWLTVLFCGTLLGGAGSYAAWELLPAKWESTALLQVDQTPASLSSGTGPNQAPRTEFGTYVKTAATLLRSDFVLNKALNEVRDLPTIKGERDPIKFLGEKLQVVTADGSEVIHVTFAGDNPADVKRIVDAVQKAYMAEVGEKDLQRRQTLLKKLEDAKTELFNQLRGRAGKPDPLAKAPTDPAVRQAASAAGQPGSLPPLPGAVAVPAPPADALALLAQRDPRKLLDRFDKLSVEVEQYPARIKLLRNRAEQAKADLEKLKTAPITDPLIPQAVEKDPEVMAAARDAAQAKRDYDFAYSAAADKTARDIGTKKTIWEGRKAALEKLRGEKAFAAEAKTRLPRMEQLAAAVAAYTQQAAELEDALAVARLAEAAVRQAVKDLPPPTDASKVSADGRPGLPEKPYQPDATDLMVQDSVLGRVAQNFYALKAELGTLERVRVIQPASAPVQKDSKKQILAAVAAGLMGYVLLAVGLVGYETVTRRVSSLADVATAGPAPVVGVIPGRPGSPASADAVDKLRAYVGQAWLARGATCVAVTSPVADEGKAGTAFGLAGSLARAGHRVLLADFDLRSPALHALAGVANGPGVCEALRGDIVDVRDAVVALPGGPDLLTAGAWSADAGAAAVGRRLDELLARLKEPYDCVVVSAHALLAAAEAVEVVRRCEAVLVCAQYRETTVPLLRRATDRAAAMEVPYAGVVYVGATDREALC